MTPGAEIWVEGLETTVPLRMRELRPLSLDELQHLLTDPRRTCGRTLDGESCCRGFAEIVASHGDAALHEGATTLGRAARRAILTTLAAGALLATGGVTFAGYHWCRIHTDGIRAAICPTWLDVFPEAREAS